jgi:uncharacterized protein with GYD domain
MPKYVALVNWTEQGVKNVKETVNRSHQVREMFQGMGVTLEQLYWTAGHYDIVVVLDGPDDQTVSAALLTASKAGNFRTETLRAFDEQEMQQILDKVS